MSASRFSGSSGQTHSSRSRDQNKLKAHRFIGVNLGGGKNDRTSLAVLDYYSGQNKLFLTHIYENIQTEGEVSGDQILIDIIKEHATGVEYICIDSPLKLPKCISCKLVCPGFEKCKEKEIVWMWKQYRKHKKKKPRSKLFTPYTQRAVDLFISTELEDQVHPLETLGANTAPLAARTRYLLRRLSKFQTIEVYPDLSVLRIGQNFKISKGHLLHYKHQVGGDESRQIILENFVKRDLVFIYQQDFHKLIANCDSFDAFITAFTGFLKYKKQCELPPKDFPLRDGWVEFPTN